MTFFRTPTATQASEEIGAVEVKTGGATVQTRTSPVFKVTVTAISESVESMTTS